MNVWFDKEKMESILKNIISNALKYTPENGNVQIFVSENNDSWSVEVKDTGIGIPREHQERIFERFYRVDKSRSKSTGGWNGEKGRVWGYWRKADAVEVSMVKTDTVKVDAVKVHTVKAKIVRVNTVI